MPRLTLSKKVFLALATLLLGVLLIFAGFSILGLQRGLGPYVAEIEIRRMDWLVQLLQKHYAANGSWAKLRDDEDAWRRLQMGDFGLSNTDARGHDDNRLPPWYQRRPSSGPGPGDGGPPPWQPAEPSAPRYAPPPWLYFGARQSGDSPFQRLSLVDVSGATLVGMVADPGEAARLPIHQGKGIVGYLVLAPLEGLKSEADRAFVARQSGIVILTGLAGLVLALALSWLLARRWFSPIDALTQAARDVASGRPVTRVPVQGTDELALLGRTFNDMAARLDTIEASRRAWLADVAHELRTPLAAMRAEIEALQDGVRSFDDRTALRLHRQVMRLGQLVDDLRSSMREPQDLAPPTRAAAYPLALLMEAVTMTRERFAQCGIDVDADAVQALAAQVQPLVDGDARRLHQVFMNLLDNTLAYTDAGGRLQLDARIDESPEGQRLVIQLDDSAPGVAPDELPRLFERLFRGEGSRSRETGGSGLGLSICRTTVEEHGGTIEAAASPLGGVRIVMALPLVGTGASQ